MSIGVAQAAGNLGAAVGLGAVMGFERQWRQRLAGLRTNTLFSPSCRPSDAPIMSWSRSWGG